MQGRATGGVDDGGADTEGHNLPAHSQARPLKVIPKTNEDPQSLETLFQGDFDGAGGAPAQAGGRPQEQAARPLPGHQVSCLEISKQNENRRTT